MSYLLTSCHWHQARLPPPLRRAFGLSCARLPIRFCSPVASSAQDSEYVLVSKEVLRKLLRVELQAALKPIKEQLQQQQQELLQQLPAIAAHLTILVEHQARGEVERLLGQR